MKQNHFMNQDPIHPEEAVLMGKATWVDEFVDQKGIKQKVICENIDGNLQLFLWREKHKNRHPEEQQLKLELV